MRFSPLFSLKSHYFYTMKIIFTLLLLTTLSLQSSAKPQKIAMVQSKFTWGDVDANIETFSKKISAIDEPCDLIILPELFVSGCDMRKIDSATKVEAKFNIAKEYQRVVDSMRVWAKDKSATIIGSTIYERKGNFYNRLVAMSPSGKFRYYDKHNCFKKGAFTAGKKHLVIDVNGHRYATYICYDLRFSEWSTNKSNRYDTAIYIANWPTSRAKDWSDLLRERAIENRANVIGVNCVGRDLSGVDFMGNSSVYSPTGELIATCGKNRERTTIATIE